MPHLASVGLVSDRLAKPSNSRKHYREVREALQAEEDRLSTPNTLPPAHKGGINACQLDRCSTTANLTDLSGHVKLGLQPTCKKSRNSAGFFSKVIHSGRPTNPQSASRISLASGSQTVAARNLGIGGRFSAIGPFPPPIFPYVCW